MACCLLRSGLSTPSWLKATSAKEDLGAAKYVFCEVGPSAKTQTGNAAASALHEITRL